MFSYSGQSTSVKMPSRVYKGKRNLLNDANCIWDRRTAKLFMPWAPQRFREGCLEIWVLREAIIHHFCSLMSLLDLLVPCTGAGRREAWRGCPAANLLWEIAHYSCCKSQYLPRSLSKHWFMRIWMWTDSLWLGVVLSRREFTPHQQKIISETPAVISSR